MKRSGISPGSAVALLLLICISILLIIFIGSATLQAQTPDNAVGESTATESLPQSEIEPRDAGAPTPTMSPTATPSATATFTPSPEPTPTPTATWFWKDGSNSIDYKPSGMPDFDQKQAGWVDPTGKWSHCGPVAVADSLWWFDSEYEPTPVAPPAISDNYSMITSYNPGIWDDHDIQNVVPLVNNIAFWVDCDGIRTGIMQSGTNVTNMQCGIDYWLINRNLYGPYYERTVPAPNLSFIMDEVERCEDLVLLLGFWQFEPAYGGWVRIGGHYVTTAGFNRSGSQLAFSDPMFDNAEAGGPGRVPMPHPFPHGGGMHNDAQFVSHDAYNISPSITGLSNWSVQNYSVGKNISQFFGMNWNPNTTPPIPFPYNASMPVETEIEYAIDVSPKPNISDVVESVWEWDNKSEEVWVGLHLLNQSWNDTIFDAEFLFWSDWTCTQWVWDDWLPNGSLNSCQWQWINVSWLYPFPPEIVVVHYSDINGSNIGFTFSEEWEEEPTPTPSPSATATASPSATATASPSSSPSATKRPTASPTPTTSPSPTATATATASASATVTASPSASATATPSATATATPSPTPTPSATPTSTPEYFGDATKDGFITVLDLAQLRAIILGSQPVDPAGDATADGFFTVLDLAQVRAIIQGSQSAQEIGKATYDFSSGAGTDRWTKHKAMPAVPPALNKTFVNDPGWSNLSQTDYANVSAEDSIVATFTGVAANYSALQCRFTVGQPANASTITSIGIIFNGSSEFNGDLLQLWAWNFNTTAWNQLDSDISMTTANTRYTEWTAWGKVFNSYINATDQMFILVNHNTLDRDLTADYIRLALSYPLVPTPTPTPSPTATASASPTATPTETPKL